MASNYGLGGGALSGFGLQAKDQALDALGGAAKMEQDRNLRNKEADTARKAGNAQLGGTLGAMGGMALGASYGSVGGPLGALIGGVVGALGSRLF